MQHIFHCVFLPYTLEVDILNLKRQPFRIAPPLVHAIPPSKRELAVGKDSVVLRV